MGMEFFANAMKFHPETNVPLDECPGGPGDFSCVARHHFDYIQWALITVFQCLTGENWNAVMYDGVRGTNNWFAVLYFFGLVVLGQCVIFNLFLAILMANFQESSENLRDREERIKAGEIGSDEEDDEDDR